MGGVGNRDSNQLHVSSRQLQDFFEVGKTISATATATAAAAAEITISVATTTSHATACAATTTTNVFLHEIEGPH